MDRLDVYIDDYSLPDPMPEGMLDKLATVYGQLTEDAPGDAHLPNGLPRCPMRP